MCLCVCASVCLSVCLSGCLPANLCAMCVRMNGSMYLRMYVPMYLCICVYLCVFVCECARMCICTYVTFMYYLLVHTCESHVYPFNIRIDSVYQYVYMHLSFLAPSHSLCTYPWPMSIHRTNSNIVMKKVEHDTARLQSSVRQCWVIFCLTASCNLVLEPCLL